MARDAPWHSVEPHARVAVTFLKNIRHATRPSRGENSEYRTTSTWHSCSPA